MNKISYSQYSIWANCPLAWKLRYVDDVKFDDSSINTVFGTAMHETIQEWLEQYVYTGKDNMAKSIDLTEPLKQKFISLFQENTTTDANGNKVFLCDKKTLMEFYNQGCQILSYVQQHRQKLFPSKAWAVFKVQALHSCGSMSCSTLHQISATRGLPEGGL